MIYARFKPAASVMVVSAFLLSFGSGCKKSSSGPSSTLSASLSTTLPTPFKPTIVTATDQSGVLAINAYQVQHDSIMLIITIPDTVSLNQPLSLSLLGNLLVGINGQGAFLTNNTFGSGTIILTLFDRTNRHVTGSFNGIVSGGQGRQMTVSDGQFDVYYTH